MENFFEDNADMLFQFQQLQLDEIIRLKEDDFTDSGRFREAPADVKDALDNYRRVLTLLGGIAAQQIAPYANEVDKTGAVFKDGKVIYTEGTRHALDCLKKADLMGFTLPRRYGGLNFPKTIYIMAIELVSRADASLMTIFGLQEISETIFLYGSVEQQERYLPRFSSGEALGAMALTEPDSGSDLPSARLRASQDEQGSWRLNGVKRFITNGCGQILLVMARSEPDIHDARGLSLFIYERDEQMKIRRIEEKHGIHGSPTCELQFNDAPAELLGQRKRGLIKYTMNLMNGARLAVSAQAVGIMEAAYREARAYAAKRSQFGVTIDNFPAIYEMLTDMKVVIEGSRSLLYESACAVDRREGMEIKAETHPETKSELRAGIRKNSGYEQLLTPLTKFFTTEMGNRICYDALQIHGGVGYTSDFTIERISRDMRITSIYEGTSQMQVIAAIGGILKGSASEWMDEVESIHDFTRIAGLFEQARGFRAQLEEAVRYVKEREDDRFREFHARRIVEIAADSIISYLLCRDALRKEEKKKTAYLFMRKAAGRVKARADFILSGDDALIRWKEEVIGAAGSSGFPD